MNYRFTFLTERLIRCEYSPDGVFVDGQTQTVLCRDLDPPHIAAAEENGTRIWRSSALTLRHVPDGRGFSARTLRIEAADGSFVWSHGTPNPEDLPGTLRTLDNANGTLNMHSGERHRFTGSVISRKGWTLLDDSRTLLLKPDGFLAPRPGARGGEDFYFFGYGHDYPAALRDYHRLTGPAPLPPKFALGLWWSRWWPYKDQDLLRIVEQFESAGVPLSICVVDMDWHVVYNPHHTGWTGYTWNPAFFPDPEGFLSTLHAKGAHVCMNLHPHEGVAPHEAAYGRMCRRLGRDPAAKEVIPFELANEDFLRAYFEELHHPLEAQGVDFWWMDWQQGERWDLPDVDPLWYLNHLHARDLARGGHKRPLVFSRWGDHGSHRYPVGFSGDTFATWETLNMLPWFTAASANLGYGWRSDETGGFHRGDISGHELLTRWNQFACFSPTYRLHNCGDPGLDYLPWSKPPEFRDAILQTMRLRRELLPYIYSAAHVHAEGGPCLCRPMYHAVPDAEEAYLVPQQYLFGPDLIAAPFTRPIDPHTRLARQVVWLPEGEWFDFHRGTRYPGGRFHAVYGGIGDIPVFARAGSAIPLHRDGRTLLRVFPGEGVSHVYDDDGRSMDWTRGDHVLTRVEQLCEHGESRLRFSHVSGNRPPVTHFDVERVSPRERFLTRESLAGLLSGMSILGHTLRPLIGKPNIDFDPLKVPHSPVLDDIIADPARLLPFLADFSPSQGRCLLELLTDSGFHAEDLHDRGTALLYWCGDTHNGCEASVALSLRKFATYASQLWTPATRSACLRHEQASDFTIWKANISYGTLFSLELRNGDLCTPSPYTPGPHI